MKRNEAINLVFFVLKVGGGRCWCIFVGSDASSVHDLPCWYVFRDLLKRGCAVLQAAERPFFFVSLFFVSSYSKGETGCTINKALFKSDDV